MQTLNMGAPQQQVQGGYVNPFMQNNFYNV